MGYALFPKHLPPSAGLPRVLALDAQTAAELAGLAEMTVALGLDEWPAGPFDAIAGPAAPEQLAALSQRLRPGGRLILTHEAAPETLLAALTAAGLIHCLVEPQGPLSLYRGERPPEGSPIERQQSLAASLAEAAPAHPPRIANYEHLPPTSVRGLPITNYELPITSYSELTTPYIFLLITQTPNKPAWKLSPGELVEWRAATVLPAAGAQPVLLGFSSLVKAVAYMQGAVLAGRLAGVNKVGKFPAAAMQAWPVPLALNPSFEQARELGPGPQLEVQVRTAITGEE